MPPRCRRNPCSNLCL